MSDVAQKVKISYERKPKTLHSFFALKFHYNAERILNKYSYHCLPESMFWF